MDCHDVDAAKGNLNLTSVSPENVAARPDLWENVVRRLRGRQMPPAGKRRPDEETYVGVIGKLEASLDQAWAERPNAGRTDTIRRLTRTEYQHAVRDLLAVEVDASSLLPADDAGHGFDNVAAGNLSPTLLDRYITAAQKIARLAVGGRYGRRAARRSASSRTSRRSSMSRDCRSEHVAARSSIAPSRATANTTCRSA
jgi:hypothetical protein